MKRRAFVACALSTIAGGKLLALANIGDCKNPVSLSVENDYDVLIAGGGTSGAIAAIQAARLGAKTLLVERSTQPGGTMTNAGVCHPGIFHAWGKQVISGIGFDIVKKCVDLNGDLLPDFSKEPKRHWLHQIWLNPFLFAPMLEEEILSSGAHVIYGASVAGARFDSGIWTASILPLCDTQSNSFRQTVPIRAKLIVDCTGNASVAASAGFERFSNSEIQPGTQIYRFSSYNLSDIDIPALDAAVKEAKKKGILKEQDIVGGMRNFLNTGGFNQQHVLDARNVCSGAISETSARGRAAMLRVLRFLKNFKGLENVKVSYLAPETGVRETFRIKGERVITLDDYTSAKLWPDSICYCFYPVDLHHAHGVNPKPLDRGKVPTIPLSALVPKGSENILVAGKCVSSDRLANSALRVQAPCMAMGQAAGAAAALCAKANISLHSLNFNLLVQTLRANGAIVPMA